MEAALLDPARLSVADRDALLERYNAEVRAASAATSGQDVQGHAEDVDVAALDAQMRAAADQSWNAFGPLDPAHAEDLAAQHQRALRQADPSTSSTAELQAALNGQDQMLRFRAAAELQRRGLLDEAQATALVEEYNSGVRAAAERGPSLDMDSLPEHLRADAEHLQAEHAKAQRAALYGRDFDLDPTEAAFAALNEAVHRAAEAHGREQLAASLAPTAATTEPAEGS
jgi:hypothetical protein